MRMQIAANDRTTLLESMVKDSRYGKLLHGTPKVQHAGGKEYVVLCVVCKQEAQITPVFRGRDLMWLVEGDLTRNACPAQVPTGRLNAMRPPEPEFVQGRKLRCIKDLPRQTNQSLNAFTKGGIYEITGEDKQGILIVSDNEGRPFTLSPRATSVFFFIGEYFDPYVEGEPTQMPEPMNFAEWTADMVSHECHFKDLKPRDGADSIGYVCVTCGEWWEFPKERIKNDPSRDFAKTYMRSEASRTMLTSLVNWRIGNSFKELSQNMNRTANGTP